jgi:hypothetical protein
MGRRAVALRDAALWGAVVAAVATLAAVAVALDARVGSHAPPFIGRYSLRVSPASVLAPGVAMLVVLAVRAGLVERLPWRWLLAGSWVAAAAWAFSLALVDGGSGISGPLANPAGYLHDLPLVGDDPLHYLRAYVDLGPQHATYAREHPPAPVLLLWALGKLGLHRPGGLGVVVVLVGALAVPLVAVSVRSLCHEPAARRLLPVLVLAPYAVWSAVSIDGVALAVTAAGIACGTVGSEPGRRPWWALGAGVLLGTGSLFSYSTPWLALTLVVVYFVRRRAALNVVTGVGFLLPLWLAWLGGFVWPDGLSAAQNDFSLQIGPNRSWPLWVAFDVGVVAIACGPLLVTALRKLRRTPGWPFLVGAGLAVVFSVASGLSRGEAERAFLPFLPWLLVPVVAPDVRPARPGEPASAPAPMLLVVLGAVTGIVVQAVLRSPW